MATLVVISEVQVSTSTFLSKTVILPLTTLTAPTQVVNIVVLVVKIYQKMMHVTPTTVQCVRVASMTTTFTLKTVRLCLLKMLALCIQRIVGVLTKYGLKWMTLRGVSL
jgi:hypothetical protein